LYKIFDKQVIFSEETYFTDRDASALDSIPYVMC
jgi:hypothetical protein